MRKYAFVLDDKKIKKVLLASGENYNIIFLYSTIEDTFSFSSINAPSLEEAENICKAKYGISEWIDIDDALDFCNLDLIKQMRLKGRDKGKPNINGIWQIFENGKWTDMRLDENGSFKKISRII